MAPEQRISRKFLVWLVPSIFAIFLIVSSIVAFVDYRTLNAELKSKGDRTATLASIMLESPLWNLDAPQINQILDALSADKEVAWISVSDNSKKTMYTTKEMGNLDHTLIFDRDIAARNNEGLILGKVAIHLTPTVMLQKIRYSIFSMTATMFFMLLTVALLNNFIHRKIISQPIGRLVEGIDRNSEGVIFQPVNVETNDEIGFIARSFNHMLKNLKEYSENLENMIAERGRLLDELRRFNEELEERVALRTVELASSNEKLSNAMSALWGEMQLAKKIQTVLLPKKPIIPGYDIAVSLESADEVGGDYYDVISTAGYDWIVVGDVSGHGVTAGLVMMMVQTSIHTVLLAHPDTPASELLAVINQAIYNNIRRMDEQKHMTIVVMACEKDGCFKFSGLHEDILVWRTESRKVQTITTNGMWIGLEPDISSMLSVERLNLAPGDCMVLFTDGITEARLNGDFFGDERLIGILETSGHLTAPEIHANIKEALDPYEKSDDVTLLVLKREG